MSRANDLKTGILMLVFSALSYAAVSAGEITVYYLRHAEAGHNAPAEFRRRGIPTNEWPSWVGNPNVFTPDGLEQVSKVAGKLGTNRFDLIAVSPLWRTRNTILPYLKKEGLTAEVWPELLETGGLNLKAAIATQTVSKALFEGIRDLNLPDDEKAYFTFRKDATGRRELKVTNLAEAFALSGRVEALIRERAGTNDFRVLLVGHAVSGSILIRHLSDPQFDRGLKNACLWSAWEKPDGRFELYMLNDEPFKSKPPTNEGSVK